MRNYNKTILAAVIFIGVSSCATFFGDTTRKVQINSEPPGANIYVNGVFYAKTPGQLLLPTAGYSSHKIVVSKEGFESSDVYINTKFQKIGYLNILMPPGFFIDFASDTMFTLDPKDLNQNVILVKESQLHLVKKSVAPSKVIKK